MAEYIKRHYELVALRVKLLHGGPGVQFTLQANEGGNLRDIYDWNSDLRSMGYETSPRMEREAYKNLEGILPDGLTDYVDAFMGGLPTQGQPLWVHLVKPYSVLRFLPWERALGRLISAPVMMLPDFLFPPPRESSSLLNVALCGSAPLNSEEGHVYQAVIHASHRILEANARRTRLHIFADFALYAQLRDEFGREGRLGVDVFVHDHQKAALYAEADPSSRLLDAAGQLRSPWLLWMRDALRGESIDVMHFVCHGFLSRFRGAMLFAQSPLDRTDHYLAGPVGYTELNTFLTQIGAWSTAFTSTGDNNSEPGLRALVDDVVQNRPGPALMHVVNEDYSQETLRDAYQLLYATAPTRAPKSTALYMCCQPYRVAVIKPVVQADEPTEFSIFKSADVPHWPDAATADADAETSAGAAADASAETSADAAAGASADATDTPEVPAPAPAASTPSPLDRYIAHSETVLPWISSTERFAEQVQFRMIQSARAGAAMAEELADDTDVNEELRSTAQAVTVQTLERLRQSVARLAASKGVAQGSGDLS